jgi:hypothetical protein
MVDTSLDLRSSALSGARSRRGMRWAMASSYLGAGIIHLRSPDNSLPIMPDGAPAPREIILFVGACEIAGAAFAIKLVAPRPPSDSPAGDHLVGPLLRGVVSWAFDLVSEMSGKEIL